MVDRTQEDINQDVRIAELERLVKENKEALRTLQQQQAAHEITLRQHQSRIDLLEPLRELDPLRTIIEHGIAIKTFFDNWKRGFVK